MSERPRAPIVRLDALDRIGSWGFRAFRARPWTCVAVVYGVLIAAVVAAKAIPKPWGPGGALAVLVPSIAVTLLAMNRMRRRVGELSAAFDEADAARVTALRKLFYNPVPKTLSELHTELTGDGEMLLRLGKWAEARDTLARVDRERLLALVRPGILSELGLATAHAGEPERGLALVDEAVAEASAQRLYPATKWWYLNARRGVALSLAGRHGAAIEALHAVVTDDAHGDAFERSAVTFFLARSFHGVGREDDAWGLLEAMARRDGGGPWARRARAMLEARAGAPHRAGGAWPDGVRISAHADGDRERERDDDAEDDEAASAAREARGG